MLDSKNSTYEPNARFFFCKNAYLLSKKALLPESISTDGGKEAFESHKDNLKQYFEYAYDDCLYLPSFSEKINNLLLPSEELAYHPHFEEIKDSYKYARYLFHTALQTPIKTEHMYNSTTSQVESYDSTFYDLKTNHYSTTLRCLYSIQDKIAYFIYNFFRVSESEIAEHKVNINSIFSSNQKPATWLSKINNSYLKALYFLSQDIHDTGEKNSTTNIDPNANLFLAESKRCK